MIYVLPKARQPIMVKSAIKPKKPTVRFGYKVFASV